MGFQPGAAIRTNKLQARRLRIAGAAKCFQLRERGGEFDCRYERQPLAVEHAQRELKRIGVLQSIDRAARVVTWRE